MHPSPSAPEIPFNKLYLTGRELNYIADAHISGRLSGDGPFTALCHSWLENHTQARRALLTHSCTAALEMTALMLDLVPGDEVIMPSYTFVSTANAFVLRGAVPVFVDIRSDTYNLDESLIEAAITERTRAIVVVHYAGIACQMDAILSIAQRHGIAVIEDAAQGVMSRYNGRPLGSLGDFGCFSFHETKNIISGEGGALLVNDAQYVEKAEICREKGTDRSRFLRGQVDKYTWQSIGSSMLPGELVAAFLYAQIQQAQQITDLRLASWTYYHQRLAELDHNGFLTRPTVPPECQHNAHLYAIVLPPGSDRHQVLSQLRQHGIHAVFHYVPLHSSPAGLHYGRVSGRLVNTDAISGRLIRLPLWTGIDLQTQDRVIDCLTNILHSRV
jgi:dTDP-4-amino-4,6-dideoxygalactose transaminase